MTTEVRERLSLLPLTPTLPLQIADHIASRIVEEEFQPGERLKEVELANAFRVSRATIREALRILENRGMVSILPQRGAHVSSLSRKELEDMFDIRIVLLGLASRTLAHRCTPEIEQQLHAGFDKLVATQDDANAYARASAELTLSVAKLSGNGQLSMHIKSFAWAIGRYARLGLITPARREQSMKNWKRLIRAITSRDGEAAETLHRSLSDQNRRAALSELDRRTKGTAGMRDRPRRAARAGSS